MNLKKTPQKQTKKHPQKRFTNIVIINTTHILFLSYLVYALYQQEFRNAFFSILIWFIILFLLPDTAE